MRPTDAGDTSAGQRNGGPNPHSVTCTFVVAGANRALFTDERGDIPSTGDRVNYDSHEYEVVTTAEQAAAPGTENDAPSILVRVQSVDAARSS